MNPPRTYTRKEIAAANDVDERTVRRRERALGLDRCRDKACARPVRYRAREARALLLQHEWAAPED